MAPGDHSTTAELVQGLIRDKLDQAGMTQGDLAHQLGINRTTVNRYLCGQMILTVAMLGRIATALDCPLSDLVPVDEAVA